jgi:hypothetical protein
MPESFDGRAITRESAPKPPKLGGAQGADNASPSAAGAACGGTDNMRAGYETYAAGSSRAATVPLKRTGAAVYSFDGSKV